MKLVKDLGQHCSQDRGLEQSTGSPTRLPEASTKLNLLILDPSLWDNTVGLQLAPRSVHRQLDAAFTGLGNCTTLATQPLTSLAKASLDDLFNLTNSSAWLTGPVLTVHQGKTSHWPPYMHHDYLGNSRFQTVKLLLQYGHELK